MKSIWHHIRVIIIGLTAVLVTLGLVTIIIVLGRQSALSESPRDVDALATSKDDCVTCHRDESPGIVEQYARSAMAAAEVTCRDCHEVPQGYANAIAHEGTFVLNTPTTARCEVCHEAQVAQFNQSRHGLPSYVAYAGSNQLTDVQEALYEGIPEGTYAPDSSRHALYVLEGEAITRFACESCHDIGKPSTDGSVGQCQSCHLRHAFSLEQVRKPETCNACHIGPDHPQWEIYQESSHGISYMTGGDNWHWDADPGTLTVVDMPAATCAICHMSGFGATATTHDVGDRLAWFLFSPISERRPDWESNLAEMQKVCVACHNKSFIDNFYQEADAATMAVNDFVVESNEIVEPLEEAGLLTAAPFDQPIDFTYFDLWHHWGRTAKFGVWMQGPDYVQWHGAYEILRDLAELRHQAELLKSEGQEP